MISIPGIAGRTVGDFWQWADSDVLSNRNRSIFAEDLVGVALGVVDRPRVVWPLYGHAGVRFLYHNARKLPAVLCRDLERNRQLAS